MNWLRLLVLGFMIGSSQYCKAASALDIRDPVADFSCNPSTADPNKSVKYTYASNNCPTFRQWNFSNEANSTHISPGYNNVAAGAHGITLTMSANSKSNRKVESVTLGCTNVITAASPSLADVKAALSSARSGETVVVPAGEATWDNQLVITKGINLIGAGIGRTMITSSYNSQDNYLIAYSPSNPSANEPFRLSGFSVLGGSMSGVLCINNGDINHFITRIRVDHNYFSRTSPGRVVYIRGSVYGVIDSNEIHCVYYAISVYGLQEYGWRFTTFTPGTADNFFVEDNVIYAYDGIHATGQGGRYCIRYNTYHFLSGKGGCHPWFDAHGNQTNQNMGTMGVEIYENTLNMPGGESCTIADHRGGEGIIFDNRVITTGSVGFQVREEYNDSLVTPSAASDGEPQHISDSYYWNNRKNSTLIIPYVESTINYGGATGIVPRSDVHFWNQVDSFDGTTGMGVGPLSARPASCRVGVAYWATDTRTLYRASSVNTWTKYYTPFPYPHPLRQLNPPK